MFFKHATFFHLRPKLLTSVEVVKEAVEKLLYQPPLSEEGESAGWHIVAKHKPVVYVVDESQILLCARFAKKILPSSVLNAKTDEAANEVAEKQGYSVGRAQRKEIKEQVMLTLLKQAFISEKDVHVWINLAAGYGVVNSASNAQLDSVMSLLGRTFSMFPFLPYEANAPVRSFMTGALFGNVEVDDELLMEHSFTIESNKDDNLKVNYRNYVLSEEEIEKHISADLSVSLLGFTWADRISFNLTSNTSLQIKGVEALNALTEDTAQITLELDENQDSFDANFFMMTKELDALRGDLSRALGGVQQVPDFED